MHCKKCTYCFDYHRIISLCYVAEYNHPFLRHTVYFLSPLLWSWFLHNVFCTYVQCNIKTTLWRTQKTLNCKYTNLMAYKVLHLLLFYEVIYFSFIVRKIVTSAFLRIQSTKIHLTYTIWIIRLVKKLFLEIDQWKINTPDLSIDIIVIFFCAFQCCFSVVLLENHMHNVTVKSSTWQCI